MENFTFNLGMMSFRGSVVVCIVLLLRLLFRKLNISHKYMVLLWMIAFFNLAVPWKISMPVGFWGNIGILNQAGRYAAEEKVIYDTVNTGDYMPDSGIAGGDPAQDYNAWDKPDTDPDGRLLSVSEIIVYIWFAGVILLLGNSYVSYVNLKKRLLCSVTGEEGFYYSEDVRVPMVFGIFFPEIYLPVGMDERNSVYVLAHERMHIKRRDSLLKMLAYIICIIHWFNPIVWMAYHLFGNDMEMACDEECLREMGDENRKNYAAALLQISADSSKERKIYVAPVCFGEGSVKDRILNILSYRHTLQGMAAFAVIICILLALALFTKTDASDRDNGANEDVTYVEIGDFGDGEDREKKYTEYVAEKFSADIAEYIEAEYAQINIYNDGAENDYTAVTVELIYDRNEELTDDEINQVRDYISTALKGTVSDLIVVRQHDEAEEGETFPTKEAVENARAKALEGMTEEETDRLTENIKVANSAMENAYLWDNLFDKLSDPDDLYWNYIDETGDIQVGWNTDGSPRYEYNRFDADNFIELIEDMKASVNNEALRNDMDKLVFNMRQAKELHEMEYVNNIYKILHDMDYFLLRYGPEDVGKYTKDASVVVKFYDSLSIYHE